MKIFITGTNTDIGKTYVSAEVSRLMAEHLGGCSYLKPVATGVDLVNEDLEKVRQSFSFLPNTFAHGFYEFLEPASPYIAALKEGASIDYLKLLEQSNAFIKKHDNVVVEGAGGVLVPITKQKMMLDLMADLKLPALVIAHYGLGTVNHTCLTVQTLVEKGLKIIGVVLNQPSLVNAEKYYEAVSTNANEIERILEVPVLAQLKYGENLEFSFLDKMKERLT